MTKVGISLIAVDVDHSPNGLSLFYEHSPAEQHLSQEPRLARIACASDEHGRGSGKYGKSAAAATVAAAAISVAFDITTTTFTTTTTTTKTRTSFIFRNAVIVCGAGGRRQCFLTGGIYD
jgi:hypothetical protein